MEKGDKPKKPKDESKPKKSKVKQSQKQTQKQSVKIVIAEKEKPKRKYVRKTKAVAKPVINNIVGYRGSTAVSYLGGEGDVNQVITPYRQPQQKPQAPQAPQPPPQPPRLSETVAPATLDTELTAVSELIYPKARTPAFEEEIQPVPKKKTQAKAKSTLSKIGEGIGDFIKKNLLDQEPDLNIQEPDRPIEQRPLDLFPNPRPKPVIEPTRPKATKKPVSKGKTDVPISILLSPKLENIEMMMEDTDIPPVKPKRKFPPGKGKTEVEQEMMALEDKPMPTESIQKGAEEIKENTQSQLIEQKPKKTKKKINIIKKPIPDEPIPDEPVEVISLEDEEPLTKEEKNESLRRMIVGDTIDDIISTIQDPIFATNPDFKTISQNVDIENPPANMNIDYGDENLTPLNVEGFVPVGNVRGMIEAIEKKVGRPKKYETAEDAKLAKRAQTLESNRRVKAEKKLGSLMERYITREETNKEFEDFIALEEATDALKTFVETRKQEQEYLDKSPYTFEKQFPNVPQVYVAQEMNPKVLIDLNKKVYDDDFQSGDWQQSIGDLTSTNNFGAVKIMLGNELGYSDENPVPTTALWSPDAVDSDLPFTFQ